MTLRRESWLVVISLALVLSSCTSTPSPAAPSEPAPAPTATTAATPLEPTEQSQPVTTFPEAPQEAETPPPPTTATAANTSGPACMVWRPCSCDSGCVLIREAKSSLKQGMAVTIIGGPLKGTPAIVEAVPSTTGGETLVVTRGAPGQPSVCQRAVRSPEIGYGCTKSKSNKPIDPHACEGACGK